MYRSGPGLVHVDEDLIIRRAMSNVSNEVRMREEIQTTVKRFLATPRSLEVEVPKALTLKIVELAKFGARLRGRVSRDKYRSELMLNRPSAEVGSRLGKQLNKLGMALAIVHERTAVQESDYALLKHVTLDTVPQREEDLVRCLWERCPTIDDSLATKDLAIASKYPPTTVTHLLSDLQALGIVQRLGTHTSFKWTLSEYIRNCIARSEIYGGEVNRAPRIRKLRRAR
jgi:hypothetical protein